MNSVQRAFAGQGLVRPRVGRVIGGVCVGIARRLGIDPWLARLIFVVLLVVLPGSPILIYPILWLLMPSE
jgi:phage shock protein C